MGFKSVIYNLSSTPAHPPHSALLREHPTIASAGYPCGAGSRVLRALRNELFVSSFRLKVCDFVCRLASAWRVLLGALKLSGLCRAEPDCAGRGLSGLCRAVPGCACCAGRGLSGLCRPVAYVATRCISSLVLCCRLHWTMSNFEKAE